MSSLSDRESVGPTLNADALQQLAEPALYDAARWLSGLSESMPLDSNGGGMAASMLFGIHCALRGLTTASWPDRFLPATVRLTDHLAGQWSAQPYEFYSRFVSGGFVSAMMAAAVVADSESAETIRRLCGNAWQAVEARAVFSGSPTQLWTGRRLFAAIEGSTPELLACTWWRSEISAMTPPHFISIPAIQQIVADLAALSAYGAFDPPLPALEREYIRDLLPFLTFYYIKERDLELVNLLLRALRYARLTDAAEFHDAIQFILSRKRADGRFTMRDLASHLHRLSCEPPLDVERTIHLPLTVGSIWALSDCLFGGLARSGCEGAAA